MPKVKELSQWMKPYVWHGVELRDNGNQAIGDCPFCGKEDKFYVSLQTGQYDCKSCTDKGNVYTFFSKLWEMSIVQRNTPDLANERGLVWAQTLDEWGYRESWLTEEWILPGRNVEGKINQLYRYVPTKVKASDGSETDEVKYRWFCTPGLSENDERHGLFFSPRYHPKREIIYLCEGPWDAMTLEEVLRGTKLAMDGRLMETANEDVALISSANVLAVPGCGTFYESWLPLFSGKRVVFLYDNDHPRENKKSGKTIPPGAVTGMRRVAEMMGRAEEPPAEVHYLKWGHEEQYSLDLKDGYDVSDLLRDGNTLSERVSRLSILLSKVVPVPDDWIPGRNKITSSHGGTSMELKPCKSWRDLIRPWRKALKWTEGLDRALSVMLACVLSTKAVGDQLWAKIMGPPSCGKSTLCEALSANKKYIVAKSTIRGFHSGFKSDKGGNEDNSLVAEIHDKTLITKDGDTLLQAPNLGTILSEARDIYDKVSRTHYRNKMGKDYEAVRMTWLLCGTSSLRQLDTSELGARFLDCVIMEDIDPELEREVMWRVVNQACEALDYESNGQAESRDSPEQTEAKQITGGYVSYLRENANKLLKEVHVSDDVKLKCMSFGLFVAHMRARPSKKQEEVAEREFGSRLVSQHMRLAKCLAVVLNRMTVDDEVMRRVQQVCLDTARGRTLEIGKRLYKSGREGIDLKALALYTNETDDNTKKMLRFLRKIKAVEAFKFKNKAGLVGRIRYRLTDRLYSIYTEVYGSALLDEEKQELIAEPNDE